MNISSGVQRISSPYELPTYILPILKDTPVDAVQPISPRESQQRRTPFANEDYKDKTLQAINEFNRGNYFRGLLLDVSA